jgi:hypothetical protein
MDRIQSGRASTAAMASNIAALFGVEGPEAEAGAFALAEAIHVFTAVHTKKR